MTESKPGLGGDLSGVDAHVIQPGEYDEIPEVTEEMFARGQIMRGGQPLRGRPKTGAAKRLTSLRLDPEVVDHYRATGPGWQTRINEVLRKAAGI